ncbi:MAG TPA: DUF1549 domain-containing protein, partial [Pirellulales bacterium]|nr:DUF1549 domain-containing protein [Pirellulales bacterium]
MRLFERAHRPWSLVGFATVALLGLTVRADEQANRATPAAAPAATATTSAAVATAAPTTAAPSAPDTTTKNPAATPAAATPAPVAPATKPAEPATDAKAATPAEPPLAALPERGDNALEVAREIDKLVQAKLDEAKIPASPLADDSEFVHRIYLDITGKIPSAVQARRFLDDQDPRKREKLIDTLLADPAFGVNLATFWHNWMVLPNMPNLRIPPDSRGLLHWLAENFNKNHGWDEMVNELLTFEGSSQEKPEGVFYLYCGNNYARPRPNVLTGTVVRLFLGTQIQCAECHDHPFRKWEQKDFWGIASFFGHLVDDPADPNDERGHSNTGAIIHEAQVMKPPRSMDIKSGDPPFAPPPPGVAISIPVTSFRSVGKVIPGKFLDGSKPAGD